MKGTAKEFNLKSLVIRLGAGMGPDWGFGIMYSPWGNTFSIEFIHFYVYIEVYKDDKVSD